MKWCRIGNDTKPDWWWVIKGFSPIDKQTVRRIRYFENGEYVFRWSSFDVDKNEWVEVLDLTNLIFHFYDQDQLNPYGRGIGGSLFYYWHAKAVLYELMLQGAENFSNGWIVAYIDGLKKQTSNAFKDRATEAKWHEKLETMVSNKTFVMSNDDKIEILPGPTQGHGIIMDSLKY